MKNSIIFKTLLILGVVITLTFIGSGYLFSKSDNKLIEKIVSYNLHSAMESLDKRQELLLEIDKKQMAEIIDRISKNSSVYLLDYDVAGLEKSIALDMKNPSIVAIEVFDGALKEYFLSAYKKNDQIKFHKTLPKPYTQYTQFKEDIKLDNSKEKLGTITLYYDQSIIINQINKLKIETKAKIDAFNQEIAKQQSQSNTKKMIIAIGSLIAILLLISILLFKFVNKPLKVLKDGLDEFFLFLQNKKDNAKKIDIDTNDEFGHMAQSLNENIIVSAKLHEEIHELNTNLEAKVEEKTAKVTTLLDNAGQGFLTFDTSFLVDNEYSKECEKLLGEDIVAKDITTLLFKEDTKQKIFKESLINALNEKMELKRNSYLSLVPNIILLNKKAVKLEYKIVDNDSRFMMILTNITSEKKLEKKVKQEQEILKMIVAVVSESEVFYETKEEYQKFINEYERLINKEKTPLFNLITLYRMVHTFKGVFSQLYMQDVVASLHILESEISLLQKDTSSTNEQLLELLDDHDFNKPLQTSLTIIEEILGEEFLESENYIKIDLGDIATLQQKIEEILNSLDHTTPECEDILCQVQNLSSSKLITLLNPNINAVKQLAKRFEKEIYEFDVIGDAKLTVSDTFKPFIKSLIHVFRNSIDHGIETPEQRLEKQKDELGTISCNFEVMEDKLHIIIADDGAGIDKEKIKQKLQEKGIDTSNLTDNQIYNHIFDDSLSTKDSVSDISGRGVGMSAVKHECEQLGGEINITSSKDIGTTFEFIVPLNK